jgi:hypothetical protein
MTIASLTNLANNYKQNAIECGRVAKYLSDSSTNAFWRSQAATKFRGEIGEYKTLLQTLQQRFTELESDVRGRIAELQQSGNV